VSNSTRGPRQLEFSFDATEPVREPVLEPVTEPVPAEAPVAAPSPAAKVSVAPIPEVRAKPAAAPTANPGRPGLRVLQGGGQQRPREPLESRDAVVRVLVEAGADLLLRRISPERAEFIEQKVDKVLGLFDRVDANPLLMPVLRRELDDLEALMRETRAQRGRRQG